MNILINRTDAIGDTLLSLPLALIIKYFYPEAKIGIITSQRSYDLITLCAGLDHIYCFDLNLRPIDKIKKCREIFDEFKPTHFFHLGGSFYPTAWAFLKGVPFRGGLVSKIPSFLFLNKGVRQSRSLVEKHESEYNLDLAKPLGIQWEESFVKKHESLLSPKFCLDPELKQKIRNERFYFGGKKLIFIHPGMSGHTLNWPSEFYGQLANLLYKKVGESYQIIVSFTPSDEKYINGMKTAIDQEIVDQIYFFNGAQKGLVDFTYVLSLAALFIGPSTGTTHMANALQLKQVALYSPIKVQSVQRWGPFIRNSEVEVLSPQQIGEDPMRSISVAEVFESCLRLLNEDKA
jgi:heptosyltransferase III